MCAISILQKPPAFFLQVLLHNVARNPPTVKAKKKKKHSHECEPAGWQCIEEWDRESSTQRAKAQLSISVKSFEISSKHPEMHFPYPTLAKRRTKIKELKKERLDDPFGSLKLGISSTPDNMSWAHTHIFFSFSSVFARFEEKLHKVWGKKLAILR